MQMAGRQTLDSNAQTEQLTVTSKKALRAATLRAFVSLVRFMESRHIP